MINFLMIGWTVRAQHVMNKVANGEGIAPEQMMILNAQSP
jgi:hypothetical protein